MMRRNGFRLTQRRAMVPAGLFCNEGFPSRRPLGARGKIRLVPHRQLHLDPPAPAPGFEVRAGGLWPPTWPMGLTMLRLLLLPVFLYLLLLDAGPDFGARVN